MKPLALAALALLCACSPDPAHREQNAAAPASTPPAQAAPELAIEPEGLRLFDSGTGSARPIPFGTAQDAVIAALAFRGAPADTGALDECPAGRLDTAGWPDGLGLYFQEAKFVGWALGDDARDAPTTASGIGIGSTRAELESAYSAEVFESTLGTEFAAGELFGILDGTGPNAKITHLWGGTSCNMR